MNINKKIEEIRQKPEHIRMRYLWASVGFCMVIIIAIWILSIKTMFQDNATKEDLSKIQQSFSTTKEKTSQSIQELAPNEGLYKAPSTEQPQARYQPPISESDISKKESETVEEPRSDINDSSTMQSDQKTTTNFPISQTK